MVGEPGGADDRVEHDLRLHARDAIHGETMLRAGNPAPAASGRRRRRRRRPARLGRPCAVRRLSRNQLDVRAAHSRRQRLRHGHRRPPQQQEIAEPVARGGRDRHGAQLAAEFERRRLVVERGQHHLVRAADVVRQRQDRRAVQRAQLRPRSLLEQAFEVLPCRLVAAATARGVVRRAPEREQLRERRLGGRVVGVAGKQLVETGGGRWRRRSGRCRGRKRAGRAGRCRRGGRRLRRLRDRRCLAGRPQAREPDCNQRNRCGDALPASPT